MQLPMLGRLSDLRFDLPTDVDLDIGQLELIRVPYLDYLVRLSTQWAWIATDVRVLSIEVTGPVVVGGVLLRAGD